MSGPDALRHAVRWTAEALLRPLDALPPIASLTLVAALTALLMLAVVRRASPQKLVARARDRMAACIYEMRLFLDAPGQVLRAQARLVAWTAVHLACLVPAMLVLTPPLVLLYLHLETRHGLAPLPAPATVVLRIELSRGADASRVSVHPTGPVRVTAPLVRVPEESAVYARLAIAVPGVHRATVTVGSESVEKRLVADPRAARVAPERRGGWRHLVALGDEPPPGGKTIQAISVQHPVRPSSWLGLAVPWWVYWLGVSTSVALLLRRRFGVVL